MASYVYKDSKLYCINLGMSEVSDLIDEKIPVKIAVSEKADYDDAVLKVHEHNNKDIIDKFDYDNTTGKVLYDGKEITENMLTKKEIEKLIFDHNNGFGSITVEDKEKYDDTADKAHEHNNKDVIDKFSYDIATNRLMYDNSPLTGSGMLEGEVRNLINTEIPVKLTVTDKQDYDNAVADSHVHMNYSVINALDINSDNKLTYNGVLVSEGITASDADNLIDTKVPVKITQAEKDSYDTLAKKAHKHKNKDLLDKFTYSANKLKYNGKEVLMDSAYKTMSAVINLKESDPSKCVTYADDAVDMTPGSIEWDLFFGHYPCLFKDGKEVGKLDPEDFTKFEDGTPADITTGNSGDVMIAFPRKGLRIITSSDGNKVTISMTDDPNASDFEYNAHTKGTTAKDVFYLGAYKASSISSVLRSLSGKQILTNQNIGVFRSLAEVKGTGYEQSGFYQLIYRQCMYILKYLNLNSQATIGYGYVQSNNSSPTFTGGSETWGMDSEIINQTYPTYMKDQEHHVKLFGLEDCWGNVWEWIDGCVVDSSRNILTSNSNFNNTGSGYVNNGQGASADLGNFMSKPQGSTKTGFLPKEVNGSGSTYFCDYTALAASRVCYFGGGYSISTNAGMFRLSAFYNDTYTSTGIGARLMYL